MMAGAMGLFIASSALVGVVGATAIRAGADPGAYTGQIKICKNFATPLPAGLNINVTTETFGFTVSGIESGPGSSTENPLLVTVGSCSAITSVPTGSETITEIGAPWYTVGSITELPGQSYLTSSSLSDGTATVAVTATTDVDVVTYTNEPVTGYLEVCKQAVSGSGLTGTYAFTVTGPDGFSNSTTAAAVGINGCSDPILVPAGTDTVTEAGTNLYVTGIIANTNGVGESDIVTDNLTTGTADVSVAPSTSTDFQTDVTYTNDVVNYETCKVFSSDNGLPNIVLATTAFPFTFTATGVAGPNTAPPAVSLEPGQCSDPTALRPGTIVSVTEGIVPGTKVESIVASGADSVSTLASVTAGTISVIVGTSTSSSAAPTNDAYVTYTDEAAGPGTLKICKAAGSPAPSGTSFTFTASGAPGTTTVGLGDCAFVNNANGTPMEFPFNSTVTVTETTAGSTVSSITATPPNVLELVGSTLTQTSEPTLSNSSGAVASVVIGETTLTEVTFTDVGSTDLTAPTVAFTGTGVTGSAGSYAVTAAGTYTATATTNSGGAITYSTTSSGCSVNASTGVVTFTTTSNCVITALSAANGSYSSGTATLTITVTTVSSAASSSGSSGGNSGGSAGTTVTDPVVTVIPVISTDTTTTSKLTAQLLLKHDEALLKVVNLRIAAERWIVVAHTKKGAAYTAAVKELASLISQRKALVSLRNANERLIRNL
jgi:hypothetical protein